MNSTNEFKCSICGGDAEWVGTIHSLIQSGFFYNDKGNLICEKCFMNRKLED